MAAPIGNKYAQGNSGRWKKFDSPESMEKIIEAYFEECDKNMIPYTIAGLCDTLGVTNQTLLNYGNKDGYEEFFDIIKKAKTKIWRSHEEGLIACNAPVGYIFLLKNHFGLADKVEQEISGNQEKPLNISVNINTIPSYRTELPSNEEDVILRK